MAAAFLGSIGGDVNGLWRSAAWQQTHGRPSVRDGRTHTTRKKNAALLIGHHRLPVRRRSLCKDGKPPDGPPPP
jgi:hypothetical protein